MLNIKEPTSKNLFLKAVCQWQNTIGIGTIGNRNYILLGQKFDLITNVISIFEGFFDPLLVDGYFEQREI